MPRFRLHRLRPVLVTALLLAGTACVPAAIGYGPWPVDPAQGPAGMSSEAWNHALAAHNRATLDGAAHRRKMFGVIRKRLGYKIMFAMLAIILLILLAEIYMRIYFGTKDRLEIAATLSTELADSVYAVIKHPMEIGDSEAIKRELLDVRAKMKDIEVFICDFNQEIVYSTHTDKVKTKLQELINNKNISNTLTESLKTGIEPHIDQRKPFEDVVAGRRQIVVMRPILNEKDCYHCHGSSRKVLGGIVVRLDV